MVSAPRTQAAMPTPPPFSMPPLVMFANYPLKDIPYPHPHDVLSGRGGATNNHIGNAHWRQLVTANKELYVKLPKQQKQLLSKSIVHAVRSQNPPGRFLQKHPQTMLWYDVGDNRALEKTSQALREGAPKIKKQLKTDPTDTAATDAGDEEGSNSDQPQKLEKCLSSTKASPPRRKSSGSSFESSSRKTLLTAQSSGGVASEDGAPGSAASSVHTNTTQRQQNLRPDVAAAMYPPTGSMPLPLYPPMTPPQIPPQGPVTERKKNGKKSSPQMQPPFVPQRPQHHQQPTPTATRWTPVDAHEAVEPPTFYDDQYRDCSLGTVSMPGPVDGGLSDNGGFSFGTVMSCESAVTPLDYRSSAAPLHLTEQELQILSQIPPSVVGDSYRSNQGYGDYDDDDDDDDIAPLPLYATNNDEELPAPVDLGLEPAGLSAGSMMSFGSILSSAPVAKLETAGLSFGSVMSVTPVNGGLEDIGTSFGSMTIGTAGASLPPPSAAKARPAFEHAAGEPVWGTPLMPSLNQQRTKGNLLECSDTESEDEDDKRQISAQRSEGWDKLQAAFRRQMMEDGGSPLATKATKTAYNDNHNYTPSEMMLNIPTTFERDVSALGVDFDDDHNNYYYYGAPSQQQHHHHEGHYHEQRQRQLYGGAPLLGYTGAHANDGSGMPLPPPAPALQKRDSWEYEVALLQRGTSLASEQFGMPVQQQNNWGNGGSGGSLLD